MRDPSGEFSVHLGSHSSGAAGQPVVPKPWGQDTALLGTHLHCTLAAVRDAAGWVRGNEGFTSPPR